MGDTDAVTLRPATPADAPALARLIDIAGEGIPAWLWRGMAGDGQTPLDVGEIRAARETGGFSYSNAVVAELDGAVVGMMLGYSIGEPSEQDRAEVETLPPPIRPFVELEHLAGGTFYVNAVAVRPGRRGKGIGRRLMAAAETAARNAGLSRVSIEVYGQNDGAVRLYTALGYREAANRPVLDHPAQPYYDGDVLLLLKDL